jgi:hypothetical protein
MPRSATRHSPRSRYLAGCGKFNFLRIRHCHTTAAAACRTTTEHVFLVRTYWLVAPHRVTQTEYMKKLGGRNMPAESMIHNFTRELGKRSALLDNDCGKQRWQVSEVRHFFSCRQVQTASFDYESTYATKSDRQPVTSHTRGRYGEKHKKMRHPEERVDHGN